MTKIKLLTTTALLSLAPALLVGCAMMENQLKMDRESNKEFQDVRDAFAPREAPLPSTAEKGTGIPEFTDYTNTNAANLKPMPLVSVSVNETIPLKDVLYELAQQANYDLEIDPRITGAIIFSAKNRPFDEVMSRIADLAGLRFKFTNEVVRVEMDTPYSSTYAVDYLPMARTVTTSVQNNASFAGSGGDGGTSSSGSTFQLTGTTEVDFWKELETNIKQILESNSLKNALSTETTPVVTNAPVTPTPDENASTDENGVPSDNVPENVEAQPTVTPGNAASAAVQITPTYSINKQGGLLSVFANEKVHLKIKSYLDELRLSVSSQVLIEAKILEVTLNDEYAAGINWSEVGNSLGELDLTITSPALGLTPTISTPPLAATINGDDISAVISAVSRYGTVRSLSSPRLTVLNKQSAVLNVATNRVYFEITQEPSTAATANSPGTIGGITVETKSVPEGVLVNMTPSINPEKQEIVLNLRPTITKVEQTVTDPAPRLINPSTTVTNEIPQLSVQEFDSVLKVRSGEAVIMGGLTRDRSDSKATGVPGLSEIPLFGNLFKGTSSVITKSEIVVFLKATIVDSGGKTVHQTDKDLYRDMSRDRRPLGL